MTLSIPRTTLPLIVAATVGFGGCATAQSWSACMTPTLTDYEAAAEGSVPERTRQDAGPQADVRDAMFDGGTYAYQGRGSIEVAKCGTRDVLEMATSAAYAVGEATEVVAPTTFEIGGGEVTLQIESGRIGVVPIHAEVCDIEDIARCPVTGGYPGMVGGGGTAEIDYVVEVDGKVVARIPMRVTVRPGGRVDASVGQAQRQLRNFRVVARPAVGVMFAWDRTILPVPAANDSVRVTIESSAGSAANCDDSVCLAAIAEAADPPGGRGGITLGIPD